MTDLKNRILGPVALRRALGIKKVVPKVAFFNAIDVVAENCLLILLKRPLAMENILV